VALGHTTKMRWNNHHHWIVSEQPVHPPIINPETFQQTQDVLAARGRGPSQHKPHDRHRAYAFLGYLFSALSQPRIHAHWPNPPPYSRCRSPTEYALATNTPHPRNVYPRQDSFEADVHRWLAGLFTPDHLTQTIDQMMAGQHAATDTTAAEAAATKIADANLKLARYRAALDAGGHPEQIGKWIPETTTQPPP